MRTDLESRAIGRMGASSWKARRHALGGLHRQPQDRARHGQTARQDAVRLDVRLSAGELEDEVLDSCGRSETVTSVSSATALRWSSDAAPEISRIAG
jgi:hypothetical protein